MQNTIKKQFQKGLEAVEKSLSLNILNYNITLDNPMAVYFAGQRVSGKVNLELSAPETIRVIHVEASGVAQINWQDKETKKTLTEKESYFLYTSIVGTNSELSAGHHSFPFSFELPQSLASSYEGRKGYIRYEVRSCIDRQWKIKRSVKIVFTVNCVVDLNLDENMKKPSEAKRTELVRKMFSGDKPLTVSLSTNRYGYVPGECIEFNADVSNESGKAVKTTKVQLMQIVSFLVNRTTYMEEEMVNSIILGQVPKYENKQWPKIPMKIPPVPPTTHTISSIISMQYVLRMTASTTDSDYKATCEVPIFVGTIPLTSSFSNLRPAPEVPSQVPPSASVTDPSVAPLYPPLYPYNPSGDDIYPQPLAVNPSMTVPYPNALAENPSTPYPEPQVPNAPPTMQSLPLPYPDMPPPSYEESVFGPGAARGAYYEATSSPQENSGVSQYTPRYITYQTLNTSELTASELPKKY